MTGVCKYVTHAGCQTLRPNFCGLLLCFAQLLLLACPAFADEINEPAITDFDRDHWSFKPIMQPQIPEVASDSDLRNPIDHFIVARLQNSGLKPLPAASRITLLRRLKFDLLGLPPTPEEITACMHDTSVRTYEVLVDRFLASARYGERWAQHWLDLARFAETDGFEHDKVRPNAWRYRDWVVDALNSDMPYDRFLQLQIAGDEIEPENEEATIATAFCLSGPDMPDINSQDERRHNLLNELTATVGSVVIGLQLGCAQCHDHKYDPISQADFYRMRAFFDSAIEVKRDVSIFTLANTGKETISHVMLRGDHRTPGSRIEPGFVRIAQLSDSHSPTDDLNRSKRGRTLLAQWLTRVDHPLTTRVIVNRIWQQHFGRGLSRSSSDFGVMGEIPSHPELLDWLAIEFVEQGWSLKSLHRLIVTSAVYQRASRATESGWTEEIAFEAKTRMNAALAKDVRNELLARFPRRRLEGEIVRDAMLCASGTLNLESGGPGVMPPLPPEMLKTLLQNQWKTTPDAAQHYRRSIYVFARRNLRYPVFDVFDRPDANASCGCRDESTTATQSLLMLNSDQSLMTARQLARLCMQQAAGDIDDAIALAVLKCFGRPVSPDERQLFSMASPNSEDHEQGLVQICLGLLNANEFLYVD